MVTAKAIANTQAAEIISIRMGFLYIWTFLSFQNSIRVFQFGQNASSAFDPVFRIGTALDKTQEIAQFACGASPVALRSKVRKRGSGACGPEAVLVILIPPRLAE